MTYKFKITNTFLIFIRLFFALGATSAAFAFVLTLSNFGKIENEFLFLSSFLLITFLIFYLIKKLIVINASITIVDRSRVEVELAYFLFRKKSYNFSIADIKSYFYESGKGYKVFYLNKKLGHNFKFLVFTTVENLNAFESFYNDLKNSIQKHNKENITNVIKEKPTLYKSKQGMAFGIILVFLLILIPILYYVLNTKINIGLLLILYPGGIMFLVRLYRERKKK